MSNLSFYTKTKIEPIILFCLMMIVSEISAKSSSVVGGDLTSTLGQTTEVIEVTGDSTPKSGLIDAPVKVETLSSEYFKQQQYQDLSQAIQDIPGVMIQEGSMSPASSQALIQGFGENSVLVLIDGVPVAQNSSFGFDLSQMATSNIERVEVIKGAASSLYGSQAMGGVINIVTKRNFEGPRFQLEASGASLAENDQAQRRNIQVLAQDRLGQVKVKANFSQRQQDLFDRDSTSLNRDGAEFTKRQANLRLELLIGKFNAYIDGLHSSNDVKSESSRPFSSNSFGLIQNRTESENINLKVGLEGKVQNGDLRAILNLERSEDQLALNDRLSTPFTETLKNTETLSRRLDLQYKTTKISGHELSAGLLLRDNTVEQRTLSQSSPDMTTETQDVPKKTLSSYEFFAQDTFWWSSFEVSPGARYQYDRDFGSYVAPKVNFAYFTDIGNTGLKSWFSVGTGYRAPSVKERFFTLDHSSVANYIVVGNENLRPEESLSFQLGQEVTWSMPEASLNLYGNLFINRINGLIEINQRENTGSQTVFTYQNFNEVESKGLELGIKAKYRRLQATLNASYTETIDQSTSRFIANRPLYLGMFSLNFQVSQKVSLISLSRYTGNSFVNSANDQISPAFMTTDLKLNFTISDSISSFISLNNAFNATQPPAQDTVEPVFDGRPMRGREVFIGMRLARF